MDDIFYGTDGPWWNPGSRENGGARSWPSCRSGVSNSRHSPTVWRRISIGRREKRALRSARFQSTRFRTDQLVGLLLSAVFGAGAATGPASRSPSGTMIGLS